MEIIHTYILGVPNKLTSTCNRNSITDYANSVKSPDRQKSNFEYTNLNSIQWKQD
jgi:hypothetical protein